MTFPSSDSSVIPFAESTDVYPAQKPRWKREGGRCAEATENQTSKKEISVQADSRRTKGFQPRPRHKMRGSCENLAAKDSEEREGVSVRKRIKRKERSETCCPKNKGHGDALANYFAADNLTKERLTLRPFHRLGVFKKGRASIPVKKGLPDLAFSEMKFLDGELFNTITSGDIMPKHKKKNKGPISRAENEISVRLEPSKKQLHENESEAATLSSDSCSESKKRSRKNSRGSQKEMASRVLTPACRNRPSPRSEMVEILRQKNIHLSANQSSLEPKCDSKAIQTSSIGERNSKDINEHSEYSHDGVQARFKLGAKSLTNLHNRRYRETTARSSTDGHTTKPLKSAEENGNWISKEKNNNVIVKTKWDSNANTITKQVPNTQESVEMAKKSQVLRRRCTPEPSKCQKALGSSSPLAALLRVCADSPTRLVIPENDREMADRAWEPSRRLQPLSIGRNHRLRHQPQWSNGKHFVRVLRPVDAPEAKVPTQFKTVDQGWHDSESKPGDWETSPKNIYVQNEEDPPYLAQQEEASRSFETQEPIIQYHSNVTVFDTRPCHHVVHNRELSSPPHMMYEDRSPEPEAKNLDIVRQGWVCEAPDEHSGEDNQQGFDESSFTEFIPEISLSFSGEHFTSEDPNWELDEEEGAGGIGLPYTAVAQNQPLDSGRYFFENYGCGDASFSGTVLEKEESHPGPKRENFWRRHRLG